MTSSGRSDMQDMGGGGGGGGGGRGRREIVSILYNVTIGAI